ncbi:MAG: mechanosensitive ion channel family protein [Clostridia bacterium]|nr:mechanosensitive ion channel family protein [Clostridia bacterium]
MSFEEFWNYPLGNFTVGALVGFALAVLFGILIIHLLCGIIRAVLKRSSLDSSLKNVALTVSRIVLYVLLMLIIADYYGFPITSLITVLGVVGLAVSLALQDTLSNVFCGLLLLAAKTFASGDYVQLNGLEGTVVKVDLMNTHLRTADNKHIRIPNKDVQASPIVNYSHEPIRRVEIRVTASYGDSTEAVKAALLEAARDTAAVLDDPAPFAGLFAYGDSSIEYVLQAWTDSSSYWDAYYGMTENVRKAFAAHGLTMTYNHLNVHIEP